MRSWKFDGNLGMICNSVWSIAMVSVFLEILWDKGRSTLVRHEYEAQRSVANTSCTIRLGLIICWNFEPKLFREKTELEGLHMQFYLIVLNFKSRLLNQNIHQSTASEIEYFSNMSSSFALKVMKTRKGFNLNATCLFANNWQTNSFMYLNIHS